MCMLHHSPFTLPRPILRYTSLIPTLHYVTSFRTEIGLVEMCQLGHQKHVGHPQECGSSAFFVCDNTSLQSLHQNKTMQTKTCSAIVVALLFLSLLSIFMGNLNLCFGPHPPRAAVESQLKRHERCAMRKLWYSPARTSCSCLVCCIYIQQHVDDGFIQKFEI